jgi:hypothetical protein
MDYLTNPGPITREQLEEDLHRTDADCQVGPVDQCDERRDHRRQAEELLERWETRP